MEEQNLYILHIVNWQCCINISLLVKKRVSKHLEKIPGKQNLAEMQTIVLNNPQQKRLAENKNPKITKNQKTTTTTTTDTHKTHPSQLPQVSGRDPAAGL